MYRNIMVPLAYAPGQGARHETAAARALAAPGAKITLLHVFDPVPHFDAAQLPAAARDEMKRAIAHDLERHAEALLGAEVCVLEGDPGQVIVEQAARDGVDCIVLATHRSDTGQYGSTAARVVRHAPCTVHLLR